MSILAAVVEFSEAVYRETAAFPSDVYLPTPAFMALVKELGPRIVHGRRGGEYFAREIIIEPGPITVRLGHASPT